MTNMAGIQFCITILVMISMTSSSKPSKPYVRLVNGTTTRSGIVERQMGPNWFPLCGKTCWTNANANVTCNELGFNGGIVPSEDKVITGTTPARYNCNGTEPSLQKCTKISPCDTASCGFGAQVVCLGAVRLHGDQSTYSDRRRVEIFRKNTDGVLKWGGLCNTNTCWSQENTDVLCRQFGFRSGTLQTGSIADASAALWQHVQFTCIGNETELAGCPMIKEMCKGCGTSDDVIVKCQHAGSGFGGKCVFEMDKSCRDNLVCTEEVNGDVCRYKSDTSSTGTIEDSGKNTLLWPPIVVGVLVAVMVIVLIIAVCCYQRKRGKNSKHGQGVSYDRQQNNSNVDLGYSEVEPVSDLPDLNVNGTQGHLPNGGVGVYSVAQSDDSDPRSGSTTKTAATDHYGYGVLGGKAAGNGDDDMYSHARNGNDAGDYDTFIKNDRDTDVNDLYDHTRGAMKDNLYDDFQKQI